MFLHLWIMKKNNDFIPGSKYRETIDRIAKFAGLEIKIFDDDFSEGYKKFKERHLYHVDFKTSCYKCLKPIDGKSMVIEEQYNKMIYSTYYFHENCFNRMIEK